MDLTDYGRRLKALRKKRGLTQSQLAEMIGVYQGHIHHWENGTMPRVDYHARLSAALDDEGYLLHGEQK